MDLGISQHNILSSLLKFDRIWKSPNVPADLQPDALHVWRANLSKLLNTSSLGADNLSDDERTRSATFYSIRDRNQYLASRRILRDILGMYLGIRPETVKFEYGAHGKPSLHRSNAHENLEFNLSHSGDWMICAISRNITVGIDIEYIRENIDAEGFSKRIFSKKELIRFNSLPQVIKARNVIYSWVSKEAYVKALGIGLSREFSEINGCRLGACRRVHGMLQSIQSEAGWKICHLEVADRYAASVVVKHPSPRIFSYDWHHCGATYSAAHQKDANIPQYDVNMPKYAGDFEIISCSAMEARLQIFESESHLQGDPTYRMDHHNSIMP